MGCSHCMINATPSGEHMSVEIFTGSINFLKRVDAKLIMISGGEPTDHPLLPNFADMAQKCGLYTIILSNGMFLEDSVLRDKILALGCPIQITNDARYYPKRIAQFDHPLISYEFKLRSITPLGRASDMVSYGRTAPMCFNLRSIARQSDSLTTAIATLRSYGKMCTPSINVDGSIVAGESSECHKIGDIFCSDEELLGRLQTMKCNECGMENNLSPIHRNAIGID